MMKENKKKLILTSIVILLPILVGLILWNKLPDRVATHWGVNGVANGWSSKAFAVFGIPGFLFAMHWLCLLVASADPKKQNYSGKLLNIVFWICPVVSILVAVMVYAVALGMELNMDKFMPIFMGLLFVIIGNYLPKCKQNYTMGIKLPWTLNDEENWNYTHRLAGKMWVVGGILIMLCIFLPTDILVVTLMIVFAILTIVPMIFSYLFYRNKMKSGE